MRLQVELAPNRTPISPADKNLELSDFRRCIEPREQRGGHAENMPV